MIMNRLCATLVLQVYMKKRYHILIVLGILLIGLILGSIFDLKISEAIYQEPSSFLNMFGICMASFGLFPAYFCLACVGGGFLASGIFGKDLNKIIRILSYVLAVIGFAATIYLAANDFPSVNGFADTKLWPLSYVFSTLLACGGIISGFFICKKAAIKHIWPILCVMAVIFTVGLLPQAFIIKLFIHRPRYRYAIYYGACNFKNWWEMFPEYKSLIGSEWGGYILTKEEFKSFPSGHAGSGLILSMFLPFAANFFPKLKGKETLLFYIGVTYGAIMMLSRMLVGAHYLTDVCFGAIIMFVIYFVCNEFAVYKKLFDGTKQVE